jgi:hypothetical protein
MEYRPYITDRVPYLQAFFFNLFFTSTCNSCFAFFLYFFSYYLFSPLFIVLVTALSCLTRTHCVRGGGVWGHSREVGPQTCPFAGKFFWITTFGIVFYQSNLSTDSHSDPHVAIV